jgi:hypothetical protein
MFDALTLNIKDQGSMFVFGEEWLSVFPVNKGIVLKNKPIAMISQINLGTIFVGKLPQCFQLIDAVRNKVRVLHPQFNDLLNLMLKSIVRFIKRNFDLNPVFHLDSPCMRSGKTTSKRTRFSLFFRAW